MELICGLTLDKVGFTSTARNRMRIFRVVGMAIKGVWSPGVTRRGRRG